MRTSFSWIAGASLIALSGLLAALFWNQSPSANLGEDSLTIYCAAGIRKPVQEIRKAYEARYGIDFETVFDGSGKLLSTMRSVNQGDLYLAADVTYMEDARRLNLIDEVAPIAKQHVCIAKSKGLQAVNRLEDLLRDDIRISLADPEMAAISRAARKMLADTKHEGRPIWDAIFERAMVTRGTVNEVANDIKTGAVDVGIIWDATANQYEELDIVRVPEFQKNAKQISLAILKSSKQPTRALHFLRYMTSREHGLPKFKSYSYETVAGDKWAEVPDITLFTGGLMHPAIQESLEEFEAREGARISQVPSGCGILVAQIRSGQHPDAYFACDTTFMTKVEDVFPVSYDLSGTEMVLVTTRKRPLDKIVSIQDLVSKGLKVGLCDPNHSALGDLSKQLLTAQSIWEAVQTNVLDWPSTADRLVEAVVLGSLDAAIVYRANTTRQKDNLNIFDIDNDRANAIQPIAVANDSPYPLLTGRLIDKLRSASSKRRFEALGFRWVSQTEP